MSNKRYLKTNIVVEPLLDNWYAWSHLISPATAALNIKKRHMNIIDSYIQAPQVHASAVKNPAMLGGPFMDLKGQRIDDVKELRKKTLERQEDLFELADSIEQLEDILRKHDKGYSLEGLYDKIPDALRGYIELVYDLNNNPSFRIFEPLMYYSKYYKPESQSIALWLTDNDERPFVLSTPRLESEDVIHLEIPFNHEGIDELSKMKRTKGNVSEIKKLLGVKPEQEALFDSFFTDEPPLEYEPYTGDKVRMRYFGHACVLIETKDTSILVDPVVSYYGYHQEVERFSDMDLPEKIDYVLLTHNHQDHILFETLLPLRHKIKNIIAPKTTSGSLQDPNLKLMLNAVGFDNVIELGDFEELKFEDCILKGIPFIGEHADLNIQSKLCHFVDFGNFSMLFVADSCNVEPKLYEHVSKVVGDADIIFLGMECEGAPLSWLYGPLQSKKMPRDLDRSRTLSGSNFERGKNLIDAFNPKEVYVYAMGLEPWLEFISSKKYTDQDHPIVQSNLLVEYCQEKDIISERLFGEKELFYNKESNMELV
ncbi:MBL fold metallo-hydrolase [uncultured Aquimarina sp.]|uniref:MBL fold metallo-hydrolase n=1 Tax=uncultured Aquimarina sp. TaxID=575652 RepID=UPI00260C423D|nr:MBL fold metallo-hydrolase [uncultured Aquimarina sp.]